MNRLECVVQVVGTLGYVQVKFARDTLRSAPNVKSSTHARTHAHTYTHTHARTHARAQTNEQTNNKQTKFNTASPPNKTKQTNKKSSTTNTTCRSFTSVPLVALI